MAPLVPRTLAILVLASTLAAQRVWTVDVANGPGTDFVDIPPAVAAAADGDLIRVRAGLYTAPLLSKGLTIAGTDATSLRPPLRVANLPAGRQAVLAGLTMLAFSLSAVTVENNLGHVLFDRVSISTDSFRIEGSRHVQLNECFLGPGVTSGTGNVVRNSTATFTRTRLVGSSGAGFLFPPSRPGLTLDGATVILSQCVVEGGQGSANLSRPPEPGIVSVNGILSLRGDTAAAVIVGGVTTVPVSAIVTTGGTLTVDSHVQLVPLLGAPPIAGSATVVVTALPSLVARGAGPGGVVSATLFSPASDIVLFLTSLVADPTPAGPAGDLWIDPLAFYVVSVGLQGPGEHFGLSIPLPNDPNLSFSAWTLQAISGTLAGGFLLSGPASYSLN